MVDTDSQLITAVEVLPRQLLRPSWPAQELLDPSEAITGLPVDEAMGDAAYRQPAIQEQAFAEAGRHSDCEGFTGHSGPRRHWPKDDFDH